MHRVSNRQSPGIAVISSADGPTAVFISESFPDLLKRAAAVLALASGAAAILWLTVRALCKKRPKS